MGEIEKSVACGLGARERAAEAEALACENSLVDVAESFVLAVHIADFAAACADVASGDVGVSTDVTAELGHKALAEAHDLVVALALGVKIGAAFAAADCKSCQRVLENLLKTEKLDDTDVNRRM